MEDGGFVLIVVFGFVVLVAAITAIATGRATKVRKQMRIDEEGAAPELSMGSPYRGGAPVCDDVQESCVACGSGRLESLGRDAYRCQDCGYEGGAGYAELARCGRYETIDTMTEEERIETGRQDLAEARSLIVAAIPHFQAARSIVKDTRNQGAPEAATQELLRGSEYLTNALQAAGDGWYKLCGERELPVRVELPDPHGGRGDAMFYGSSAGQVSTPKELSRTVEQSEKLLDELERYA